MFAFLKRAFWILLGFLLIVVVVWYAGPLVAFGKSWEYRPLESETARLILIGVIVGGWLVARLIKRLRAFRASDRLLAAVVAQPQPEPVRPPAELVKLRERFDEAVATLKQQRRSGHSLYDLPWYVIIGAPGSGKTTALLNSGLKFPLEQRVGKGALRGVGGTRNCDWWFADQAIFLDTAGRYTTQDSDAASDSAGWAEFLSLLRKYRARRPINGVILTINAEDLIVQGVEAREAHVEAARARLDELSRELRIQLPVYLMVTKCDLVDGFAEYFDDLTAETRAQVWGVTFPYEQSMTNDGPQVFPAEFDALIGRLNERVFERVEQVRDPRRRTKVFAFPQQMAAMRDALTRFVMDVFVSGQVDRRILLRGVYFTSGTQDGTPIDRLLGSIGRSFGAAAAVMAPAGPGKAYFVESLLKDVMIGESGLAGINRRLEARKAAGLLGAYVALGLIAAAGVAMFTVSYRRNLDYLKQTASQVEALDRIEPVTASAPLERVVPRLDAIRSIVESSDRYREATTWAMSWGLYQGRAIGNAAHLAYVRELESLLLPRVASQIRRRLIQSAKDPETLFLYLKGYLMLSQPKHLDKQYLQMLADLDWKPTGVGYSPTGAALSNHLDYLLKNKDKLSQFGVDAATVRQARASIPPSSWARILYDEVKRSYEKDKSRDLRIDTLAGLEVEKVFKRKSGVPLSTPMPGLYTREAFKHVTREGRLELIKRYTDDEWVWGQDTLASITTAKDLGTKVIVLYERDYIKQWDDLVDDIEFVSYRTVADTNDALRILASQTSPLRGLVRVISNNTTLVENAPPPAASGVVEQAKQKLSKIGSVLGSAQEAALPSMEPGTIVTAHFQPIRALLTGDEGKQPLDTIIQLISEIQQQFDTLGPDAAGADPSQILTNQTFRGLIQTLRQRAVTVPPGGLRDVVLQVASVAGGVIQRDATGEIERLYEQQVLPTCRALIANRYPFSSETQPDVQLADFATVFGYDGLFDKFFEDHLHDYVDTSSGSWQWRPGSINPSRSLLDQFQAAQRVREMFFPPGQKVPALNFAVTVADIDANATRFILQIDGQNFDGTRVAPVKRLGVWPGPASGQAQASFEGRYFDPPVTYGGPWAWFRMIDASLDGPPDGQSIRLSIQNRYHQAHVIVESTRAYNPFATRTWRQFSCES